MLITPVNLNVKSLNKRAFDVPVCFGNENETSSVENHSDYSASAGDKKRELAPIDNIIKKDKAEKDYRKTLIDNVFEEAKNTSLKECSEKILGDTDLYDLGELKRKIKDLEEHSYSLEQDIIIANLRNKYKETIVKFKENITKLQALHWKIKHDQIADSQKDEKTQDNTVISVIKNGENVNGEELTAYEKYLKSFFLYDEELPNNNANNFTCVTHWDGDENYGTEVYSNDNCLSGITRKALRSERKPLFRIIFNGDTIVDKNSYWKNFLPDLLGLTPSNYD